MLCIYIIVPPSSARSFIFLALDLLFQIGALLPSSTLLPDMSDPNAAYRLWDYVPSVAAGIAAAAVFGILMIAHIGFLFKKRTYFCIPLAIGAFCTYYSLFDT